jgi:hypothetical protein
MKIVQKATTLSYEMCFKDPTLYVASVSATKKKGVVNVLVLLNV